MATVLEPHSEASYRCGPLSEILIIHTDTAGEITKRDLEKVRQVARDIDQPRNRIKAIVSVMMLREGWDVHNVSVVLGLWPFTAKAEILPEQVIGRGLRLMTAIEPDRTQTLEVLGTRNLLDVLREQLEAEGVGVATTANDPLHHYRPCALSSTPHFSGRCPLYQSTICAPLAAHTP